MQRTKILNLPEKPAYPRIRKAAAAVWNEILDLIPVYQYQHGFPHHFHFGKDCEGWMDKRIRKTHPLHSQTVQTVRRRYFQALRSYHTHRRNGNTKAMPPQNTREHFTPAWLKSAIRFELNLLGKYLFLAMGKGRSALQIKLPDTFDMSDVEQVVVVELVYIHGRYALHMVYRDDAEPPDATGDEVLGIDLGEIHPMVTHDGKETLIFNGRYIRSLYRLRNKALAHFQKLIANCEKFSTGYRRLVQRKWKYLHRLDRQIMDAFHKHTSKLRDVCIRRGIGTVVIGDLKGIRRRMKYGRRANQKLHQWAFGKLASVISYKCEAVGIKVVSCDEAYTSQTCPACGERRKPTNRNYRCKACGFTYHRDGVGAINIRKKYLGQLTVPVAAAMIPPRGFRLETRGCPLAQRKSGMSPMRSKRIPSL